jgi:Domain of unknown function (DUF5655)
MSDRPLWRCPRCDRLFANPNRSHACARHELAPLIVACAPQVRLIYDRIFAFAQTLGPLIVLPEKTRIGFQVRMSFAAFMPRKTWLDGHLVPARQIDSPRFRKMERYSPRNLVHFFRLFSRAEVDREFEAWLTEAHQIGDQKHLRQAPQSSG